MGRRDENHLRQDWKLGVALGLGYSYVRAGEVTGNVKATVQNHLACNLLVEVRDFTRSIAQTKVADEVESSKEAWLKQVRGRRSKHFELADKLIKLGVHEEADADTILKALRATEGLLDRDPDTSKTQKHEHAGEVVERHIYEIDAATLAELRQATSETRLIDSGDVIDGELAD